MTTSSNPAKAGPYVTTGSSSTQYPFAFTVADASDVRVVLGTLATELSTGKAYVSSERDMAINSEFAVVLNDNQEAAPGGYATLDGVASGLRISILRNESVEQTLDLPDQGPWDPAAVERAMDRLVRMVQMARADILSKVARPVCEISTDYGYDLDLRRVIAPLPVELPEQALFDSLSLVYVRYTDNVAYEYHCYAAVGAAKSASAWKVVRQALDKSTMVPAGSGRFSYPATDLATVQGLTYTLGT